ncbi:hypothetical protein NQ318_012717 [Aromia moschata]|uniref:Pseudouridine-5'-phosphatase n=1 Tax=Aromia moschata TaxID=1265417 RepID=A0AAV8Y3W3_9CUCU|nr:hypothetical protein NQ318_012717 [Aromia moschata]
MDGLLIESESVYDKIIGDIAAQFGKEIAVTEMQLPLSPEEFLADYKQRVMKELQNPELMPGAKELVRHLHKNDIPIAVATSSSQESMEMKTKNHYQDVFRFFHHIVCGSTDTEVKHGKPAPDIFLVCASRFPDKPDPSQCLVLEDAPNGVVGAIRAGMQAVMVPAKYVGEELRKPATLVLESLNDFKPELFGLPARE